MFYKLLEDGSISYGQFVHSIEYMLDHQFKDNYTLPIDGWYWFDTIEEANTFFGITGE